MTAELIVPTAETTKLYDPVDKTSPDYREPPRSVELLLVNEGGRLITGPYYVGALAWGFKPKMPPSVKARESAKLRALLDRGG